MLVISERASTFLSKMEKGQTFSKADYATAFGEKLSKGTIQNDLHLKTELGLLEKIGKGPSTRYICKK